MVRSAPIIVVARSRFLHALPGSASFAAGAAPAGEDLAAAVGHLPALVVELLARLRGARPHPATVRTATTARLALRTGAAGQRAAAAVEDGPARRADRAARRGHAPALVRPAAAADVGERARAAAQRAGAAVRELAAGRAELLARLRDARPVSAFVGRDCAAGLSVRTRAAIRDAAATVGGRAAVRAEHGARARLAAALVGNPTAAARLRRRAVAAVEDLAALI